MSGNGGAILGLAVIGGAIAFALGSGKKGAPAPSKGGGLTPTSGGGGIPWPPTPTPVHELTGPNDGPAQGGHSDPNQQNPPAPYTPPAPPSWLTSAGGGGGGAVPHDPRGGVSTGPSGDDTVHHD